MFKEPIVGAFTSTNADGSQHATAVWIDIDGDDILVNTVSKRRKARNARRDPNVGIVVIDPANPYRVVSLAGTVTAIDEAGAVEHIDALTERYTGLDKHPPTPPDEGVRVKLRIRPDRIWAQPADT
jgi:PPOX class probable F420-dependent enzyme